MILRDVRSRLIQSDLQSSEIIPVDISVSPRIRYMRSRDSLQSDDFDFELLFSTETRISRSIDSSSSFVYRELLLPRSDLLNEIRNALLEMILRCSSDDQRFSSRRIVRGKLVDAILIRSSVEFLSKGQLSSAVGFLVQSFLQLHRLTLQSYDLLVQSPPRLRSGSLELVLHRLKISHEVGEISSFSTERGVLLDEACLDALPDLLLGSEVGVFVSKLSADASQFE